VSLSPLAHTRSAPALASKNWLRLVPVITSFWLVPSQLVSVQVNVIATVATLDEDAEEGLNGDQKVFEDSKKERPSSQALPTRVARGGGTRQ
jgi:hypothetical protein